MQISSPSSNRWIVDSEVHEKWYNQPLITSIVVICVDKIKSQIEHRRLQLAMSGQEDQPDEVEMRLRDDIEDEKER